MARLERTIPTAFLVKFDEGVVCPYLVLTGHNIHPVTTQRSLYTYGILNKLLEAYIMCKSLYHNVQLFNMEKVPDIYMSCRNFDDQCYSDSKYISI